MGVGESRLHPQLDMIGGVMMVYLDWTMQLSGVEGAVGARSMTLVWTVLLYQGLRRLQGGESWRTR